MKTQDRAPGLLEEAEIWGGTLRRAVQQTVREFITNLTHEELAGVLGAAPWARTDTRVGYRHGERTRTVGTFAGPVDLTLPRARLTRPDGTTAEWESQIVPRYVRRAPDVNAAVLRCYFGGVNQRRMAAALRPLLKGVPLSKSAVSRLVGQLVSACEAWRHRSLADEDIVDLLCDGFHVKVRLGGKSVSVPVLAALGVRRSGEKVLLALELAGDEGTEAWALLVRDLVARGLRAPILAIIDGAPGLRAALVQAWPHLEIQRCTVHKARNLLAKAPAALRAEVAEDYRAFIYAATAAEVRAGHERFLRKWDKKCPGVATSLREAGDDLLTFTKFPPSQWKALRTTNALERLNQEFRRRVKTQGGFPSEAAVLVVLYGLVASGHVRYRRMDGWEQQADVILAFRKHAA